MPYSMMMGSANRGCVLMLVDRSSSMSWPFGGRDATRRSEETARALNRCLQEIALSCQSGDNFKDRCDLGVIGYGSKVQSALAGDGLASVVDVANNPTRVEQVKRKIPDGAGGLIEVDYPMPIWIEPEASGSTPMAEAFELARKWTSQWVETHKSSFPPVVINITDGEPNDMASAGAAANRLKSVATNDGSLLLFNVHISGSAGSPTVTPNSAERLPDEYSRFLFEVSSAIPPSLLGAAEGEGLEARSGARGFIYNADIENMIRLLRFGTTGTMSSLSQELHYDDVQANLH